MAAGNAVLGEGQVRISASIAFDRLYRSQQALHLTACTGELDCRACAGVDACNALRQQHRRGPPLSTMRDEHVPIPSGLSTYSLGLLGTQCTLLGVSKNVNKGHNAPPNRPAQWAAAAAALGCGTAAALTDFCASRAASLALSPTRSASDARTTVTRRRVTGRGAAAATGLVVAALKEADLVAYIILLGFG